jgi:hypothetical protein
MLVDVNLNFQSIDCLNRLCITKLVDRTHLFHIERKAATQYNKCVSSFLVVTLFFSYCLLRIEGTSTRQRTNEVKMVTVKERERRNKKEKTMKINEDEEEERKKNLCCCSMCMCSQHIVVKVKDHYFLCLCFSLVFIIDRLQWT